VGRRYLLAIDQGTTGTRALLFGVAGDLLGMAQKELPQIFPREGWVEHDPEEIWRATLAVCVEALAEVDRNAVDTMAIGITNQRETTILWDRQTGKPINNAIVWQDRRTSDFCRALEADGHAETIRSRTGLIIDPYFSASKIAWLLDEIPGARKAAEDGSLAFGTVESFLLWRLTGGRVHATDATNAARTMLFNIHDQAWDAELLEICGVPAAILPDVRDNAGEFGVAQGEFLGGEIPITGMAGDQHAAMIGQACLRPGMIKATYGTGGFLLLNTGANPVDSDNRLLTTIAYRLNGEVSYALEGSIFAAGAAVQWLRDGLGVIADATESEALARSITDTGGVYLVPAFTGLGAPYWDAEARGAIVGLTRASGAAHVVRAALEAVCYQTADLMRAMTADGAAATAFRVDGGMVANDWLVQYLADILDVPVDRPRITETTALGAAFLAGLGAGIYASLEDVAGQWGLEASFQPNMDGNTRQARLSGWRDAVERVRS